MAKEALGYLEIDGASIFLISEQLVNRLLVCGMCNKSGIEEGRCKGAFRASLDSLLEKIERYEDWFIDE